MKISLIIDKNENKKHIMAQIFGLDVYELDNPEKIDTKIEQLKNQKYNVIFISDELAGFSQDVIRKYNYDNNLRIVIMPNRK